MKNILLAGLLSLKLTACIYKPLKRFETLAFSHSFVNLSAVFVTNQFLGSQFEYKNYFIIIIMKKKLVSGLLAFIIPTAVQFNYYFIFSHFISA